MKVKNRFLINYILVFIITSIIALAVIIVLSIASSYYESSLVKNKNNALFLMKDNIQEIEFEEVLENNGGVQIINEAYEIILTKGKNNFTKKQLTASEFTDFLVQAQSINRNYSYSVAYNEKNNFWLVVTFPTSVRIDFNITHNSLDRSSDTTAVMSLIGIAIVAYLVMLFTSTLIYSRMTASAITKPLEHLRESANKLSGGDYSVRVSTNHDNELGDLEKAFNKMADKIEKEIDLRKRSESIRRQLTLDIAHDLKNPLAVIMGYVEYCLNNPSQDNKEYLNLIHQKSSRANALINGLFELSKLESPEYKLSIQKCDLSEYLRAICAKQIQTLDTAGLMYDFDIPENELSISFDPKEMDRVFDNIFENTIRHNEKGTRLNLEVKDFDKYVQITISDNGKGIPKSYAENIFRPFVRTDEARNSETGGSGLGLAIVDKIIKMHNGDISLDSDLGRGCSFIITLPKD